jgi:topoisomerase-4 subunit A
MSLKVLMGQNFIEYASYVIKDRAIPEINDGFKPVQRRILHSLVEMDDGKFNKVANVVGHCMKYHPHGDASIYDALVNLANKEYFIEKQGNFGNIYTGDAASAARYIECRLSALAKETLFNKDITDYVDSYDGRNKEPVFLPCKLPILLLAGTEGIAVGMATKIVPHNFIELLEGQIKILKNEAQSALPGHGQGREQEHICEQSQGHGSGRGEAASPSRESFGESSRESFPDAGDPPDAGQVAVEIYPDFLQGGIMDVTEYNKGNGKVKVRALIEIKGPKSLVIREIPYGTTTESVIASIENAAKRGKIKITLVNDFTADQVEIEVIPAKGISAEELLPALYAFTDCEVSISTNLIAIHDNKPRQFTVYEILRYNTFRLRGYLEHELQISLHRQQEKWHEKTMIQIFIENRIYKDIEEKKSYEEVQRAVLEGVSRFRHLLHRDVTLEDVELLLQIQIKRISRFDLEKNLGELREIEKNIHQIQKDLSDLTGYTIRYIQKLLKKYSPLYPRRTRIQTFGSIDAKKVALANIKVRFDEEKGYLGTEVKEGKLINVSDYDRILCIHRNGTYTVTPVPKKKFIGEDLLYVDKFDKNVLFNLIYRDVDSGLSYCKRFQVEKFILDKEYPLFKAGGKIQAFAVGGQFRVRVIYKPQARMKVTCEVLDFGGQLIKGVTSIGNRVSTKQITHINLVTEKHVQETI